MQPYAKAQIESELAALSKSTRRRSFEAVGSYSSSKINFLQCRAWNAQSSTPQLRPRMNRAKGRIPHSSDLLWNTPTEQLINSVNSNPYRTQSESQPIRGPVPSISDAFIMEARANSQSSPRRGNSRMEDRATKLSRRPIDEFLTF